MTALDLTKAATTATAWAWKLLENPFTDFLKRRWEDAKSDSEKAQYLQTRWNEFDWGKAAERYKERMKANYGYIRVLGSTEPKSLDDLFTDVNILEKPLAFRRFDLTKLHELQEEPEKLEQAERIPGLRVIVQKRGHRLYILGQPGAGKTTFMKYLVHQTMVEGLDKIPIFITIKDWADSGKSVSDFIVQQFDICHFPNALPFIEYVLDTGKAVVLFDGLDEVKQEDNLRTRITTALHDFSKKYSETQTVVTCRVAASDYSFTEFTYVEISDFTDGQIESYARKWFGKDLQKANQFLEELKKSDNKGVLDLGRSPLLLSLICLAYDETLHIPQRRVELYEESLDALLKKWDASRNIQRDEIKHPGQAEAYKKLSLGRKKQMFARLAAETFEKGEIFFHKKYLARQIEAYFKNLPPADATTEIDGEVILRAIEAQHGILTERAQGIYSFSHLTFQEYYTAKYIADNAPATWDGLVKHIHDRRWREVFLLNASLPDEADELFSRLQLAAGAAIRVAPPLSRIQGWVEDRAGSIEGFHPGALRSIYWYLALDRDRDRDLDLDLARARDRARALALARTLDRALARALDRNLALDRDLALARALARDRALDHDRALALDFDLARARARTLDLDLDLDLVRARDRARDLALALALALALDRDLALDLDLALALDLALDGGLDTYLEHFKPRTRQGAEKFFLETLLYNHIRLANIFTLVGQDKHVQALQPKFQDFYDQLQIKTQTHFEPLSRQMEALRMPKFDAPSAGWEMFEHQTRTLIMEYFGFLEELALSIQQWELATNYLEANQLIVDCLEVAYVRDREAILSKILTVEPLDE